MFQLGNTLKQVREAKGLSQKELAALVEMAQAQYSRLESGKTEPSFNVVVRIVSALGLTLPEFFKADEIFNDAKSYDKTLLEKLRLLDLLDDAEKSSIYTLIDSLVAKKRMKDSLQNIIKD